METAGAVQRGASVAYGTTRACRVLKKSVSLADFPKLA
jgi:hypothetical protein